MVNKAVISVSAAVFGVGAIFGFAAPASAVGTAGNVASVAVQSASSPSFELLLAKQGDSVTGGVLKLAGAKAEIVDGELWLVDSSGRGLERLPYRLPDASGKPVGLLFDISDPYNVVFRFVPVGVNRADFWDCASGVAGESLLYGAAGAASLGAAGAFAGVAIGLSKGGVPGGLAGAVIGGALGGGAGFALGTLVGAKRGVEKHCG